MPEKRLSNRVEILLSVTASENNYAVEEYVDNMSQKGIMLKSQSPYDVGVPVEIAVDALAPAKLSGTVAWVKKNADMFDIGIRLKRMDPEIDAVWSYLLKPL
ncbi:MAG: PilZ domain-containing protein [Pseudomonadota bacterium]